MDTANLYSITRVVVETVTTGSTGNIALPYLNNGTTFVVAPLANGQPQCCFRTWVSGDRWFLTLIDPTTGETKNNFTVELRYLVIRLMHA